VTIVVAVLGTLLAVNMILLAVLVLRYRHERRDRP